MVFKPYVRYLEQSIDGQIPCLKIRDWPDFPTRGVMLDISRDKVYQMQTLYTLVNQLASWKINQLQLYTEHTFAYQGHERVWLNASPMTPEEIQNLDQYCKEKFIELVPNQNSFGHMSRWLKHPEYQHLAETTEPFRTPWGKTWITHSAWHQHLKTHINSYRGFMTNSYQIFQAEWSMLDAMKPLILVQENQKKPAAKKAKVGFTWNTCWLYIRISV